MPGKIPQAFIDELLNRVDIVEVIDSRMELKRGGRNYKGLCPFHKEKTPSFSVNPDKQFYYCFGCGAGGNAIGFVMEHDRQSFPEAVENLAKLAGLEVPREDNGRPDPREALNPIYDVLTQCDNFYQQQLRKHPSAPLAVKYLKGRGLTGKTAKTFGIGLAPAGWDNLLKALGGDDKQNELLATAGMLIAKENKSYYDRFRDRIMFPIRDVRGRVIAFGGRVMGDDTPKYLNSPETPAFNKSRELYGLYESRMANRQLDQLVIVEGYMDVVALAQAGISYAAATLGTAVGKAHLERVFRYTPKVIFCFDGDNAGRAAARRALEATMPLMLDGRQANFLFLEEGEDPDSLVSKIGKDAFEEELARGQSIADYLFETLSAGLDLGSLDGRARLSKLALPLIQKAPEGIFKKLLVQELAKVTGLDVATMGELAVDPTIETTPTPAAPAEAPPIEEAPPMESMPMDGPADGPPPTEDDYHFEEPPAFEEDGLGEAPEHTQPPERLEKRLVEKDPIRAALALLLFHPALAPALENWDDLRTIGTIEGELLVEMLDLLQIEPDATTYHLVGRWVGTHKDRYARQLLSYENFLTEEEARVEFLHAVQRIRALESRKALEQELAQLTSAPPSSLTGDQKHRILELMGTLKGTTH